MTRRDPQMRPSAKSIGVLQDRIAFWCLYAFVFTIPFEEAVPRLGGFLVSRWLGLAALTATGLRAALSRRVRRPAAVHVALAAFAAWSAATILWSTAPESTLARAGTYAQLMLLVWMIWELARSERRVAALMQAYVLGALASSLEIVRNFALGRTAGVLGSAYGVDVQLGERYTAGTFNVNDLGLAVALSVPMSIYLMARVNRSSIRYIYWLQLGLSVVAITLTASRGSMLALAAALVIVPLVLRYSSRRRWLATAAVFAVALAAAALTIPRDTSDRFLGVWTELSMGTLAHRTTIWAAGLDLYQENPLAGVGAGAFPEGMARKLNRPFVAHNTFLSVLAELGVTGALIFAGLAAVLSRCVAGLPRLEKRLWSVLLLAWTVGVFAVTWEYRKPTWLLFALLPAHAAACERERLRRYTRLALVLGRPGDRSYATVTR